MSDLPNKLREHAKHVTGVLVEQDLNRAANEIERLRVADSAKSKYIKELRVVNRALNDEQTNNLKRIEELKEQSSYWENVAFNLALGREETSDFLSGHHIVTTNQIREAWEYMQKENTHWNEYGQPSTLSMIEGFARALAMCGIVRCEGCSDGYSAGWLDGKPCLLKHKDCNGEGWVKDD